MAHTPDGVHVVGKMKMGKTRGVHETTPELRNRMVGMYEAGLGLREIAVAVNCSQRTVKRWLNRFDKEGTVETRERCGRKRATTSEQDDAIIQLATQTPITAAKAVLPALGLSCSVDTVRERLHKAGIHNWSPSRKHMQRIPLGKETDGGTIQQAVWRPTGTQLGKKRCGKNVNKSKKGGSSPKKKVAPHKIRAKDLHVGDGAPSETLKQPVVQPSFIFPQQSVHQQSNTEIQTPSQPLSSTQVIFASTLDLVQQPQHLYHHPGLNVPQNWPLDLVQSSHHYPQGQTNTIQHNQHLQHLHQELQCRPEQHQEAEQQVCRQVEGPPQNIHSHLQCIEQQQVQQSERLTQTSLSASLDISEACSNSSSSNDISQMSNDKHDTARDSSKNVEEGSNRRRKKKGGKVKGTLETSVEIRNRMIGMSEAGLSTLSIALAINRSERTVKRWLERWHKEGNVQTKERKGRRRITTKEEDEAIIAMATQHPLTAAKYVAPALGLKCSVDTIRERLHKAGIHSWKLGKKQGEGNAVHTVHLWQPSGNRSKKLKLLADKKKKLPVTEKQDDVCDDSQKRSDRKKKVENLPLKTVPPPANMIHEESSMQFQNLNTPPSIIQPLHTLPANSTLTPLQLMPADPHGPPSGPTPMQPMGPIMQQRPDCRLVPTLAVSSSSQANSVAYTSCMVANNNHACHMEQADPLNYEPYIWSF
ncbi:uncharacterized protein LOC117174076 isoform X3 [Belonocnema kinseyi]|uniref:uncharacterized protein LOC117174076 isoform X3 n=1 Tax=Belonocnema kinseyi TaxID=2817044 RepID=UPI00143D3929|nr:uncharacterized protein LOC117174076 isoform X3 [Belonocnema kinseyi]